MVVSNDKVGKICHARHPDRKRLAGAVTAIYAVSRVAPKDLPGCAIPVVSFHRIARRTGRNLGLSEVESQPNAAGRYSAGGDLEAALNGARGTFLVAADLHAGFAQVLPVGIQCQATVAACVQEADRAGCTVHFLLLAQHSVIGQGIAHSQGIQAHIQRSALVHGEVINDLQVTTQLQLYAVLDDHIVKLGAFPREEGAIMIMNNTLQASPAEAHQPIGG